MQGGQRERERAKICQCTDLVPYLINKVSGKKLSIYTHLQDED